MLHLVGVAKDQRTISRRLRLFKSDLMNLVPNSKHCANVHCIVHLFVKEPWESPRSELNIFGLLSEPNPVCLFLLVFTLWLCFHVFLHDVFSLEMFLASQGTFEGWRAGNEHSAWHWSHRRYAAKSRVFLQSQRLKISLHITYGQEHAHR